MGGAVQQQAVRRARRGGRRRGKHRRVMGEINITPPFVDVMLVLLIIFMVAAPP